jgi:hypothetical protein
MLRHKVPPEQGNKQEKRRLLLPPTSSFGKFPKKVRANAALPAL